MGFKFQATLPVKKKKKFEYPLPATCTQKCLVKQKFVMKNLYQKDVSMIQSSLAEFYFCAYMQLQACWGPPPPYL